MSEIYHSETLSILKGNDGKFGVEEKIIMTDFKLLKVTLTERPHTTAVSHIDWILAEKI